MALKTFLVPLTIHHDDVNLGNPTDDDIRYLLFLPVGETKWRFPTGQFKETDTDAEGKLSLDAACDRITRADSTTTTVSRFQVFTTKAIVNPDQGDRIYLVAICKAASDADPAIDPEKVASFAWFSVGQLAEIDEQGDRVIPLNGPGRIVFDTILGDGTAVPQA